MEFKIRSQNEKFKIFTDALTNLEFKFLISDFHLTFSYSVPMHMMRKYIAKSEGFAHIFLMRLNAFIFSPVRYSLTHTIFLTVIIIL